MSYLGLSNVHILVTVGQKVVLTELSINVVSLCLFDGKCVKTLWGGSTTLWFYAFLTI